MQNEREEKAQQLIQKFTGIYAGDNGEQCLILSKLGAIILCDEVISAIEPTDHEGNKLLFWQSVKKVLENK